MSAISDVIATAIINKEEDYCAITSRKPTMKAAIDKSLTDKGHAELIRTDCSVA